MDYDKSDIASVYDKARCLDPEGLFLSPRHWNRSVRKDAGTGSPETDKR
jgi:hypothetical protein